MQKKKRGDRSNLWPERQDLGLPGSAFLSPKEKKLSEAGRIRLGGEGHQGKMGKALPSILGLRPRSIRIKENTTGVGGWTQGKSNVTGLA